MQYTITESELSQHETKLIRWQMDRDKVVVDKLMKELSDTTKESIESIQQRMQVALYHSKITTQRPILS